MDRINSFLDNKIKSTLLIVIVVVLSALLCLYFGNNKQGFYMDEYYTMTNAVGVGIGIDIKNGQWNDTAPYLAQVSYDKGDTLAQLFDNTANNVHPPMYYLLIYLASSFVPGVFTKWAGISVNIILFMICQVLVYKLAYALTEGNKKLSFISLLAYAFSPAIISGVMLIRMYLLFSIFTVSLALIYISDIKREKLDIVRFIIPTFCVSFCGFLTQYYFVIYLFFITFFYCVYLFFIKKKYMDAIIKGATVVIALAATYIVWPTSVYHIFKGYRGTGSFEDLVDTSSAVVDRVLFFIGLLNQGLFGGMILLAIIIVIAGLVLIIRSHGVYLQRITDTKIAGIIILGLTSVCYFAVITKIGLRASEASNRYQYPVYGIMIILLILVSEYVFRCVIKKEIAGYIGASLLFVLITLSAYMHNQVLYLYPEELEIKAFEENNQDTPLVVLHRNDGTYDARIQDLLRYDKVYFEDCDRVSGISDSEIIGADELLVFIDRKSDVDDCLRELIDNCDKISEAEQLYITGSAIDIYLLK